MLIVADTHVHLYGCYKLEEAFRRAEANLGAICRRELAKDQGKKKTEEVLKVLFLTERSDCDFFGQLAKRLRSGAGHVILPVANENGGLWIKFGQKGKLLLVAGRQITTSERLEVLALACTAPIPDGLTLERSIEEIKAQGGLPVLNWSMGKWLFERGKVVRQVIETAAPDSLLIGDISVRPWLWGEPALMKLARRRGFKRVAGTDPLPFPGEERALGRYGIAAHATISLERPIQGLKSLLLNGQTEWSLVGRRDGLLRAFYRQWRCRRASR